MKDKKTIIPDVFLLLAGIFFIFGLPLIYIYSIPNYTPDIRLITLVILIQSIGVLLMTIVLSDIWYLKNEKR